jgi:hypothetical protein
MTHSLLAYISAETTTQKATTSDTWLDWMFTAFSHLLNAIIVLVVVLMAIYLGALAINFFLSRKKGSQAERKAEHSSENKPAHHQAPKVILSDETTQPKPRTHTLNLDSVSGPIAKPVAQTPNAPSPPPPASTMPEPQPAASSSVGPGDFEKSLAQAGQRMDTLLAQTIELTRQLKLSEKAKTEATVDLGKAISELKAQISTKDEQISKLENTLDRKSTYPSLRALLEVKKLCLDMIGTQKPLPHDELIAFVTGAIDGQLEKLDIQSVEFPVGTPLEKIPGDQVESVARHESTDDPAKHNQVARLLQPCYFFERDSKRIIIAKALVVLYRLNPPVKNPETTPQTPNS